MKKNTLLLISFLLSFVSFSYQLLISYNIIEIFNDHYFFFSLTLGVYLLSFGFGSFKAESSSSPEVDLIHTEKNIIKFSLICSLVIIFGSIIYFNNLSNKFFQINLLTNTNFKAYDITLFQVLLGLKYKLKSFYFIIISIFTIFVGYFSGKEIPLLMKLNNNEKFNFKIYAVSYFGILASGLFYAFFLHNLNNKIDTFFIMNGFNLALLIFIAYKLNKIKLVIKFLLSYGIIFILLQSQKTALMKIYHLSQFKPLLQALELKKPQILGLLDENYYRQKTKYQLIEIVDKSDALDDKILYLNKAYQFNFKEEFYYHETMIHVPISQLKNTPKNILLIGGGDFFALRELLKYKSIKKITQVELDKEFMDFMKNHPRLKELNKSEKVLKDQRLKILFDDAYNFVKNSKNKKYDLILIDIPFPSSYELSTLYSKEFYNKIYTLLNNNGLLVIDVPLYNSEYINDNDYKNYLIGINSLILNTLDKTKFKHRKIYGKQENSIFIQLSKEKTLNFNYNKLIKRKINHRMTKEEFLNTLEQEFPYQKTNEYNSIFKPIFKKVESFTN